MTREEAPFSMKKYKKNGIEEKRYLGLRYFQDYKWLAASGVPGFEGAWCICCALFNTFAVGGAHSQSGVPLDTTPAQFQKVDR